VGFQETLRYVDTFAKDLHNELVARNLTEIVDIIFVSDHGMTDTSHPDLIYMDDILGEEGTQFIEHEDGKHGAFACCPLHLTHL
jgi:predicted AlkP superfamily pyrophosphatase or phosphodiesterase